jgi:hypothetical protein
MRGLLEKFSKKTNEGTVASLISLALCVIVFAITFQTRVDFITQKEGFHVDEVFSIIISDYSDYGYREGYCYDENVVYTGKQIKELSLWNNASIEDAFSDVKKLYFDNRDRPHTNLYYSCFRLWFAGIATTDLRKIIDRGCKLNLLFFIFSFFFMYKLLRRLFKKDKILIPFSLLLAFANTGSISNTLFLRPYQLQETLLILFTYSFVRCYESLENRTSLYNFKNFLKLVPIVGLTLLSGYFVAIYVLMLMGILAILCRKTDQKENLKFVGVSFLSSVLFARALFCGFFYGFTCGRAGEAYKQFGYKAIVDNTVVSFNAFYEILRDYLFSLPVLCLAFLIAIILSIIFRRSDKKALLISSACFIWSGGIIFLAPFKVLRYVMACFPLMTLVFPFVISRLNGIFRDCAIIATLACSMVFWNRSAKIENLYIDQDKSFEFFTKKTDVPVLILNKTPWKYSCILHQFSDVQRYEFPRSKESLETKLKKYDFAIVLFSDDYTPEEMQNILPKNFDITSRNNCEGLSGYELKRIRAQ